MTSSDNSITSFDRHRIFSFDSSDASQRTDADHEQTSAACQSDRHQPWQIEGKTVKAIATLSLNRSPSLPDLASAHEQGLINFDASNWSGFFLPRGTPMAIVRKLHDATVATMNTPEVQMHLKRIGADLVAPERRSPQYLTQFVASEIDKWAGPIKAAGVTGE
jgi:tripartite-type tricarboxylate transporter receptor subunit TctC